MVPNIAGCSLLLCFILASVVESGLGSEIFQQPSNCGEVYRVGNQYEGYYAIFPNPIKPDEVDLVYCGVDDGMVVRNSSATRTNAKNCQDLKDGGMSESGINIIYPYATHTETPVVVFCEQSVMGGGWTVFQRRDDFSTQLDFYRNFDEYALGFGSPGSEFWLGNDIIHELTQQSVSELYVDLTSFAGVNKYAHYDIFNVGPRSDNHYGNFELMVGHYTGTAGDSLGYLSGMAFSTYDSDNDVPDYSCAEHRHGAWWYNDCAASNLNGNYFESAIDDTTSVFWLGFSGTWEALKTTRMMTRGLKQQ